MLSVPPTEQGSNMAAFVQIVEFTTSRIDEVEALADAMRAQREAGTVLRGTFTSDRVRLPRVGYGELEPPGDSRVRVEDGGALRRTALFLQSRRQGHLARVSRTPCLL